MKRKTFLLSALVGIMSLSTGFAVADDNMKSMGSSDSTMQMHDQDQIYGSQLMTEEERTEYRSKMRSAQTAKEREDIRNEHHQEMQDRAREQGVTLPATPPAHGGMGEGMGGMGTDSGERGAGSTGTGGMGTRGSGTGTGGSGVGSGGGM